MPIGNHILPEENTTPDIIWEMRRMGDGSLAVGCQGADGKMYLVAHVTNEGAWLLNSGIDPASGLSLDADGRIIIQLT